MNNAVIGFIRTVVPMLVAGAATWLGRKWGFVPDADVLADLSGVLVAAIGAAYYALVRSLETRWPRLGWLLGYARTPEYPKP